jgi:hypothetical protein
MRRFTNGKLLGSAAILVMAATPASAITFFNGAATGMTPAGTPIEYTFDVASAPMPARIDFTLGAFGSVNGTEPDGTPNSITDTFSFALNGADVFLGSFGLGGGGTNTVFLNSLGGTITPTPTNNGGTLRFEGLADLLQGTNRLTFNFASTATSEQFSVNAVEVTAAVPEPTTWAMMLLGFFAVGAMMRSPARRRVTEVSYS